jgi:hypothetical protein
LQQPRLPNLRVAQDPVGVLGTKTMSTPVRLGIRSILSLPVPKGTFGQELEKVAKNEKAFCFLVFKKFCLEKILSFNICKLWPIPHLPQLIYH